jgi:hypothetical protein
LWRAIERSHGRSAVFDFEGSMKEEIERSFRYFGAVQTPQVTAVAARTLLGRGYRLVARMRASKRGHRAPRTSMLDVTSTDRGCGPQRRA